MKQYLLGAAVAAAAASVVVACSSSTGGVGSGSRGASSQTSSSPAFPSSSPVVSSQTSQSTPATTSSGVTNSVSVGVTSSGTAGESESASTSSGTPVTVRGSVSGRSYTATLYVTSRISDCAAHSYGARMIAFFRQHPCTRATRYLFTVPLGGRTVIVSSVSVSMPPATNDPYAYSAAFIKLEKSDCGCGINDLFREGYSVPGGPKSIPANEAFRVIGQDNGTTVFDAWYQSGHTRDQAPALIKLEEEFFLTQLGA